MSSAHIDYLKFNFKEAPDGNPSVEIKFTGAGFTNGEKTAKLEAQYIKLLDKQEYYTTSDYELKLLDFPPAFDFVYVKFNKISDAELKIDFYLKEENPDDIFATSICDISNQNNSPYESTIYGEYNEKLGKIKFDFVPDDISYVVKLENSLKEEDWHSATLYNQDMNDENGNIIEDIINSYPIEDGKIRESINYWKLINENEINGKYCLRVRLVDNNNNATDYKTTIIACSNGRYETNELAVFTPEFSFYTKNEFNEKYCISDTPVFDLSVVDTELKNKIIYYRYAESEYDIEHAKWELFSSENGKTNFWFYMTWLGGSGTGGEILDGEKNIYVQISDGVGNKSEIIKREIYLYRQKPNSIVFNLIGSSGSQYYTGMYKNEDGQFIATNKIHANIYAQDNLNLKLEYKLYLGNSSDNSEWKEFDAKNTEIPFYLDTESDYGIFDNNYPASVNLIFRNEAGVVSDVITRNIFFNTTLLRTDNTNLRETSNSYKPIIEYYNGDEYVAISELEDFNVRTPKRSWNEIFYPETHSFPIDSNGNIDIQEAMKIVDGNINYDAIKTEEIKSKDDSGKEIITKRIVYDSEQRPLTIWNEFAYSKKYRGLQSNNKTYNSETGETEGLAYWIIDNTGYSDFQLEFEHFHLDNTSHVQINDLSPFTGDCLVVYDASDKDATNKYTDRFGRTSYKLADSTKLKMISAYTGDGVNAVRLYSEDESLIGSLNATSNGAFTTEKFNSTSRICLIFYSDGSGEKSGFKIKASPARGSDWTNWEVDNKRGEVWLHKIDTELLEGNTFYTLTEKAGYCPDDIRMSYEYSNSSFDIDYEKGSIIFDEKPQGQVWGTFSYYNYDAVTGPYKEVNGTLEPITNTFALADDDLVDYKELSIYVSYVDENDKVQINKSNIYDFTDESDGKIITNTITYKDSGLIKFENNSPPKNKIFADYYCHSFYRLTDDGYGNLYFYDDIIVPDKTEHYPDFTYVDLKVVNEGEATLRNGKIKFTFRGIASGTNATTITSVLNPDRPWDVQVGTPEETFDQVGGVVSTSYNFPTMNWVNALAIYGGSIQLNSETTLTGGKTEINFHQSLDMKQEIYLRVVWTMFKDGSNENSPNYITPSSAGEKCFSGEIEGSFYTVQI